MRVTKSRLLLLSIYAVFGVPVVVYLYGAAVEVESALARASFSAAYTPVTESFAGALTGQLRDLHTFANGVGLRSDLPQPAE